MLHRLCLFPPQAAAINLPPTIVRVLEAGADLGLSSSGGKDSQAQQRAVSRLHRERRWNGRLFAIHADLGRIEWYGTLDHIRRTCAADGLPLVVVQAQRGMVDEWQHRHDRILAANETKPFWSSAQARYCTDREKTQPINKALRSGEKPFWSSATARYCTKHEKTAPIDKTLRLGHNLVVCAVGIRAQESPGRAKKPRYQVRSDITTSRFQEPQWCKTAADKEAWADQAVIDWLAARDRGEKVGRLALTWHPILNWTIDQVWAACGTSALEMAQRVEFYKAGDLIAAFQNCPVHWAYATGNSRLSCSMCVLASLGDLGNGAKHNPQVWLELALMELESGWDFKRDLGLHSLAAIVTGMPLVHLKQVWSVLHQLGLVKPSRFALYGPLLAGMPIELLATWTAELFEMVVQALDCKKEEPCT